MRSRLVHIQQHTLNLRRKQIYPTNNQHIVAAPRTLVHPDQSTSTGTFLKIQARQIARPVTNNGQALLGNGRKNQLAQLPLGQNLQSLRINNLRNKMVFINVQTTLVRTFKRNTRTNDLTQAININGLNLQTLLNLPPHILRPRFCPKNADAQFQVLPLNTTFLNSLSQVRSIRRRTSQYRTAKILHQLQLPLGIAPRNRNHRSTNLFPAIVYAQTTGKQTIAIGNLNKVIFAGTR